LTERVDLEYNVQVTGLEEARTSANSAAESASQASAALSTAQAQGRSSLPTMIMAMRSANAARLAISQTSKAITELNPTALMYGFLNMMQVVNNLTSLTRMLKDTTGSAASAQAVLAALTGNWWLIPVALAAGALVYSRVKSMQTGGEVSYTGLHILHKGEYVLPKNQAQNLEPPTRIEHPSITHRTVSVSQHLGPVFITFEKQPQPQERGEWLRDLGSHINEQLRRGT
jgi:hypothetical protein